MLHGAGLAKRAEVRFMALLGALGSEVLFALPGELATSGFQD
jgi:hypothetical protein